MRIKILKNYKDLQLNRLVVKGEEIGVDDTRAKELITLGLAQELIPQIVPEADLAPPLKTEEELEATPTVSKSQEKRVKVQKETDTPKGEPEAEPVDLDTATYSTLQRVAKANNLKANQKKAVLRDALKAM